MVHSYKRRTTAVHGLAAAVLLALCSACGAPANPANSPPRTSKTPGRALGNGTKDVSGPSLAAPPILAVPKGSVGTRGAVVLIAASESMGWATLCQARKDTDGDGRIAVTLGAHGELEGDQMQPYLILGDGPGVAIDSFANSDPSGRYVAVVQSGRLLLIDSVAHTQVDLSALGADVRRDKSQHLRHRAVTFSPLGGTMAYVRKQGPRTWVILRELASGQETPIDPGAGLLWRINFEPGGHFLRMQLVTEDTNGNRRLDWTTKKAVGAEGACPSPIPAFPVFEYPGDAPTSVLYHTPTKKKYRAPGFVATAGDDYVYRTPQGELLRHGPSGRAKVSSEECSGRLLHADDASGSLLFGCAGGYGQRRELFLRTTRQRKKLGLNIAAFEADGRFPGQSPLLLLNPGNDTVLLDVQQGKKEQVPISARMIARFADTILGDAGGKLVWLVSGKRPGPAGAKRPALGQVHQQGPWVSVGSLLMDLKRRRVGGRFAAPPVALSANGHGLVPTKRTGYFNRGPLRWTVARKPVRSAKPQ